MLHKRHLIVFTLICLLLLACHSRKDLDNPFYTMEGRNWVVEKVESSVVYLHEMDVLEKTLGLEMKGIFHQKDIQRIQKGDVIQKERYSYDMILKKKNYSITLHSIVE